MARKGSRKVRTGCLTCKIRKVKCDEAKPSCARCTSTGRKCDGYADQEPAPAAGPLWYRPRTAFQGVDDAAELAALQRFTEELSPVLAGPLDPYFWTHLVMQFSHFEPAVRHSLVAISSLYAQPTPAHTNRSLLSENAFALHHYNAAIRELRAMRNEPLVLLVCVLFTCIEVLQGNVPAAAQHCRHGTVILSHVEKAYPWARQYLSPIFRRINVMPFFFGQRDFPRMTELDDPIPESFDDLAEAQLHLDGIVNRAIHLLRYGMIDRVNIPGYTALRVPQHILDEQLELMRRLKQWQAGFAPLRIQASLSRQNATMCCYMIVFAGIARIWVETTLKDDEMMYDKYLPVFCELVDEAAKIELLNLQQPLGTSADPCSSSSSSSSPPRKPKFSFEMGFTPALYFIVLKCRDLSTRLRALSLLRSLAIARENLWEGATHYAMGKRVIELEHQIRIGDDGVPAPAEASESGPPRLGFMAATGVDWTARPPDDRRVRSTDSTRDLVVRVNEETGVLTYERKATFYFGTPERGLYHYIEMMEEVPRRWW
ncbi:hypothetical protein Micbo1qcDRAFT_229953 [Microdochium bolleyi]|uniref:Zn(2)-C6 fungal-type domain-containing protein n=1 Tax=Microdochium bolleyi TaxID=196109 RepID=A0A136JJB5_9PEZI|nr:hypothetical protein Micbo1qcDRAFT_229953 [Microdochium bolleyi]